MVHPIDGPVGMMMLMMMTRMMMTRMMMDWFRVGSRFASGRHRRCYPATATQSLVVGSDNDTVASGRSIASCNANMRRLNNLRRISNRGLIRRGRGAIFLYLVHRSLLVMLVLMVVMLEWKLLLMLAFHCAAAADSNLLVLLVRVHFL